MANLLKDGMTWLAGKLQSQIAEPVRYWRGGESVAVSAALGNQLLRTTDARGNTKVERADRDFLLRASDLVLNGDAARPEAGDLIDLVLGSETQRFEVMPIGSEAPWRWSDPFQTILRVHTKYRGLVS